MRGHGSPGNPAVIQATAFRNGSLQGAYVILAARSARPRLRPDVGLRQRQGRCPSSFPDGIVKSNFLCNLGYGDPAGVKPRSPRFAFDEVCRIL